MKKNPFEILAVYSINKMTTKKTLYLSFDIEADGPSPSVNSMLSIGIWGFDTNGREIATFQRNIKPHPSRTEDLPTKVRFWDKNLKIKEFVSTNQADAEFCMEEIMIFYEGLKDKGYNIKWVARPSAYDWQWLNCYYNEFGPEGKSSIGYSALCISTLLTAFCKLHKVSDDQWDGLWAELTEGEKITHNPLDDARCQGKVMFNLMNKMNIRL